MTISTVGVGVYYIGINDAMLVFNFVVK